jgi:hypothetical protein
MISICMYACVDIHAYKSFFILDMLYYFSCGMYGSFGVTSWLKHTRKPGSKCVAFQHSRENARVAIHALVSVEGETRSTYIHTHINAHIQTNKHARVTRNQYTNK